MIPLAVLRALGQAGDPRFRGVLLLGVGLAALMLAGSGAAVLGLLQWALPETVALPWIGPVDWLDTLLGAGTLLLVLGLSVVLMVPVAAAVSGLFLDRIVDAVEARHYPALPPAREARLTEGLAETLRFLGVMLVVNALALAASLVAGPFAPLVFWSVNGLLLGREYFTMVAQRRLGRAEAQALRRANAGRLWLAGTLMAAPLSIPVLNLVVPVLGVAAFTHLFHAMRRQSAG